MRARYNYAYSVYNRGEYRDRRYPCLRNRLRPIPRPKGANRRNAALALSNLGRALRDIGRLDEALDPLTETLDIRVLIMGPEHLLVGVSNHDLAKANYLRGDVDLAEIQLRDAFSIYTVSLDSTHRVFGSIQLLLARIDLDQGQPREASECLNRGRPLSLAARGEDHVEMLDFDTLEAVALGRLGDQEAADARIAEVTPRLGEVEPKKQAMLQLDLGRVHTMAGRFEDAELVLLESHGIYVAAYGGSHYMTQQTVQALIAMYDAWAESGSAEATEAAGLWRARVVAK